ncbi:MAG: molybdopterin-dependent oxidoreductase [Desulfobacteraceae bacterium]|nr:molybdopterin-dependent oxidoreductase [Desulfobacteraceae bacterium]
MKQISSCTLDCQDTCSTIIKTDDDGRVSISGNPDHPFTRGVICAKGKRALQRRTSPHRITTPLIKRAGSFEPVSWDAALDLVAKKIKALRHEPAAMLHVRNYGYRGVFAEGSNYLFNLLGASATRGSLCDEAGCTAFIEDFGALEMNAPEELLNAGHIVNWGKDFSRSSIHLAGLVKNARKKGCGITTISPGGDGNRAYSDHLIRIRPGTDRFLAAAVIKAMLEQGLASPRAMDRASGLADFMALINGQTLDGLLTACDCKRPDLDHLLNIYADPGGIPVASIMGWGIQRYLFGGENVRYINALAFLSGQVGIRGGGIYFNIPSSRSINTGWAGKAGSPCRALLLPRIGLELLEADPGIKLLLADGTNFVNQAPDSKTIQQAMEKIDFKVVVDAFMTDTARLADVILPCALDHEREEILGSCFHTVVNYSAPVFPPAGDARCDFEIMAGLADRLALPFPNREDILADALDINAIGNAQNHENSIAELRETGFIKTAHPDIAWEGLRFAHGDGNYRLPDTLGEEAPPPDGFPLHLLSLVNRDFLHSQIPEEKQQGLPNVWINPDSPVLAGLDRTAPIFLATPLGRMPVKLCFLDDLHPFSLIIRRGGWMMHGQCANHLIGPKISDMGETAAYYSQYARLEN